MGKAKLPSSPFSPSMFWLPGNISRETGSLVCPYECHGSLRRCCCILVPYHTVLYLSCVDSVTIKAFPQNFCVAPIQFILKFPFCIYSLRVDFLFIENLCCYLFFCRRSSFWNSGDYLHVTLKRTLVINFYPWPNFIKPVT